MLYESIALVTHVSFT